MLISGFLFSGYDIRWGKKVKILLQFILHSLWHFNLTSTVRQFVLTRKFLRSPEILSLPPCTRVAFHLDGMPAYHTQSGFASLQLEYQGLGTQGHRPGWLDRGVSRCPSHCIGHTHSCAERLWDPRQFHIPTGGRPSYWENHSSRSQSRGPRW